MKIALDAMGGDNAPKEIVLGALAAYKEFQEHEIILVGNRDEIRKYLPTDLPRLSICHAETVMAMDENIKNVRKKKDSSIFIATDLVRKGEADAVISAGSTGAQMATSTVILGRVQGVTRPAITVPYPTMNGSKVMLDMGANLEVSAQMLTEFAKMGIVYARTLLNIDNPRVYLLSNGSEEQKGTTAIIEAHQMLKQDENVDFQGNIEARDLIKGDYDVVVTDGFTGNAVLKTTEGVAVGLLTMIKDEVTATFTRKIGAALVKPGLKAIKDKFDYSEYGGAPLLGVDGISIICHGSSGEIAIKNAIKTAITCHEKNFIGELTKLMAE